MEIYPNVLGLLTAYGYFRAISWFHTRSTTKIYNPVYGYGSALYHMTFLQLLNGFPAVLALCTGAFIFYIVNAAIKILLLSIACAALTYSAVSYGLFRLYRPLLTGSDDHTFKAMVEEKTKEVNTEYFSGTFLKFILNVAKQLLYSITPFLFFFVPMSLIFAISKLHEIKAPLGFAVIISIIFATMMIGIAYVPFLVQKFYKGGVLALVYRWSYRGVWTSFLWVTNGLDYFVKGLTMITHAPVVCVILAVALGTLGAYKIFQHCKNTIYPGHAILLPKKQ